MLSQVDYDNIMKSLKSFEDKSIINLSDKKKINRILKSQSSNDSFILNIDRGTINIRKIKYQTRHNSTNTILLRIDTHGPRHQNPDGEYIDCPHIHIFKEHCDDKWAYPLDSNIFKNPNDFLELLKDFLIYFNVKDIPDIINLETCI
ncbi:MAG: hypothetical protein RSB70_03685 [Clostridium sp.]